MLCCTTKWVLYDYPTRVVPGIFEGTIKSKIKNYTLRFVENALEQKSLLKINQKYLYLIDENVYKIYQEQLKPLIGKNNFVIEIHSLYKFPAFIYKRVFTSAKGIYRP